MTPCRAAVGTSVRPRSDGRVLAASILFRTAGAAVWHAQAPTAKVVRQRIAAVLEWAVAMEFRSDNPCDWVGRVLGAQREVVQHMQALPHREVAAAVATVRASTASPVVKLAFEFLVLTAARYGEVRLATWDEIDTAGRVWTIPATRMKLQRDHRVPLCGRALEILKAARTLGDGRSSLVFPGQGGTWLAGKTLRQPLRNHRIAAVVHGFRSSFRDWAAEETDHRREVIEASLAHVGRNPVEAVHARSDLFERRRLMNDWAATWSTPNVRISQWWNQRNTNSLEPQHRDDTRAQRGLSAHRSNTSHLPDRSGRELVTHGHQARDGDRGEGHQMRAPGYEKIQAGDDEDPGGQGSVSGARSEDTTSWLLIPVRYQEPAYPMCTHWAGEGVKGTRPRSRPTGAFSPRRSGRSELGNDFLDGVPVARRGDDAEPLFEVRIREGHRFDAIRSPDVRLGTIDRNSLGAIVLREQRPCHLGIWIPGEKVHHVAGWIGDDRLQGIALEYAPNLVRGSDYAGNVDVELVAEQPLHGAGDLVGTIRLGANDHVPALQDGGNVSVALVGQLRSELRHQ